MLQKLPTRDSTLVGSCGGYRWSFFIEDFPRHPFSTYLCSKLVGYEAWARTSRQTVYDIEMSYRISETNNMEASTRIIVQSLQSEMASVRRLLEVSSADFAALKSALLESRHREELLKQQLTSAVQNCTHSVNGLSDMFSAMTIHIRIKIIIT